jgi:light-harvesting protein B-800-850 alpha chain
MNQGKIWRVVKPTIGVPIFLVAVATASFAVHYQLLTHTTWVPAFLNGGQKAKAASVSSDVTTAQAQTSTPARQ